MDITEFIIALFPMLIAALICWMISYVKKDVSIVDSLWSIFFIIASSYAYMQLEEPSLRAMIVMLLVTIWGIRLSLYITIRHWGHAEDHRYQEIRSNNSPYFKFKSLYLIFGFQAAIAWVIALPLFYSISSSSELTVFDYLGVCLWIVGMYFESVSDYQLYKHKADPANTGRIMGSGLWKYSRHPNYFGEFLIWWGYFCFAISSGNYLTIISPLLMTFLLMKFSGVFLLEKTMKQRPGYAEYMNSTNAFFPWISKVGGRYE